MSDQDDPFRPTETTVLRPRPGLGKRAPGEAPMPPRSPASRSMRVSSISDGTRQILGAGLNPLVRAASSLLLLAGSVRGSSSIPDLNALRQQALDEIRDFEEQARDGGVPGNTIVAARYALCSTLDEAVLATPWGGQSEWAQKPLLVALHREAWGGEKFFDMLDQISAESARHIDLLELLYLCLAFGFAGKYSALEGGHNRLAEVQRDLYRRIRSLRDTPPADLSLRWKGVEDRRNPLVRYVPWWVVASGVLGALAVTYFLYYAWLGRAAAPVQETLANIGLERFVASAPAPQTGPTLKVLLRDEEARGAVAVDEEGGRSVVVLLAPNLFSSGSATLNAAYDATLGRVAAALNAVPGRVLVVGHTDDQPIRSLQYRDNFELSRDRAVSVVERLQQALDNPARLQYTGVGSSEPRYRPESSDENRARNRRVEIIHVAGN